MIRHARTAVKFFVYGLLIGLLFAPRRGQETRQQVIDWVSQTIKDVLGGGGGGQSNTTA